MTDCLTAAIVAAAVLLGAALGRAVTEIGLAVARWVDRKGGGGK